MTDDIKLAILLMVGHWYTNREAVSDYEKAEVPMSFRFLTARIAGLTYEAAY
ncbi:head-tail connector protein [Plesiomonas shigelloides subsp. oncorhynchi]|nr:head-tail connector protein [Plesiomonas shigelloides]